MTAVSLEEGVEEHKKLVHYVARRFQKRAAQLRVEYDDLVSEGMIGLIKAFQKFDESYGVKFSTYAVPMIEGQIRRFFRDLNFGPKFSRHAKELAAKLTGEETVKEIVEKFQVPKWRAEEALASKTINITASIDMKLNDPNDKDLTLLDLIEYREDFSRAEVDDFLSTLTPKLKRIALLAMKDLHQQEIADKVGCSQVHVSRCLKKIGTLYSEYSERGNEGMSLKNIRLRIIDLLDQHKGTFEACKGCAICTEIKQLRKNLERDSAIKFKHILDKGQDMKKSDIAFLIDNDVEIGIIAKAVGMSITTFRKILDNYGFTKPRRIKPKEEEKVGKIEMTAEEFVDLKYKQNLTMTKIAQLKGVAGPSMHSWKDRHANEIKKVLKALNLPAKAEKPAETAKAAAAITIQKLKQPEQREPETKPVQTPQQPVTDDDKTAPCNCLSKQEKAEYESLIAALRSDLTEAHKQLDERDEKIRNLEHLHDACEDCENEISSLQQANVDMKKELLAVEKEKEELQSKYETILNANKRLNEHTKDLVLQIKPLEDENQAMRLLIKKWA